MPGFCYFLPGETVLSPAALSRHGLIGMISSDPHFRRLERGGPDGAGGILVTDDASMACYNPDAQEWRKDPHSPRWCGRSKGVQIRPEDLARDRQFSGHLVTLLDGCSWLVPIVRRIDGQYPFPGKLGMDESGEIIQTMLPEYEDIARDANEIFESALCQLSGNTDKPLSIKRGWEIAVKALGLNYRVGSAEVTILGLLSNDTLWEVLEAIVDFPSFIAVTNAQADAIKKKVCADTPDGLST